MSLRIGAKIDNYGPRSLLGEAVSDARRAEEAGFDSLWMSDHILMPESTDAAYPFSHDGTMSWDPNGPWFDTIVWSATLLAVTERVEVGVGALIPGIRNPLELAKQIATLDRMSGGRFVLGVGTGWLKEEFVALAIPPVQLGQRLDEWVALMRQAWTGRIDAFEGELYRVEAPVIMQPTPARDVPIVVGGMSERALRRVVDLDAGWLPLPKPGESPIAVIGAGLERIETLAAETGKAGLRRRHVYNAASPEAVGPLLLQLEAIGVTDVLVDVDFADPDGPRRALDATRG